MNIKQDFLLIKGTPNYLNLSAKEINSINLVESLKTYYFVITMSEKLINHYTKYRIFELMKNEKIRDKKIAVINDPEYLFAVTYNKPTDQIVVNLGYFGIKEITTKPGFINLYSCLIYGYILSELISGRKVVQEKNAKVFTDYLQSIILRVFGKKYGLLGSFVDKIQILKYVLACYVLASFFGVQKDLFRKAYQIVPVLDYRQADVLEQYDFSNIDSFIAALSRLDIFPNINKHLFVSEIIKKFHSVSILPALEDISRFVAIITTSELKGNTIVPTFLEKYNEEAYSGIVEISKSIFKR